MGEGRTARSTFGFALCRRYAASRHAAERMETEQGTARGSFAGGTERVAGLLAGLSELKPAEVAGLTPVLEGASRGQSYWQAHSWHDVPEEGRTASTLPKPQKGQGLGEKRGPGQVSASQPNSNT